MAKKHQPTVSEQQEKLTQTLRRIQAAGGGTVYPSSLLPKQPSQPSQGVVTLLNQLRHG